MPMALWFLNQIMAPLHRDALIPVVLQYSYLKRTDLAGLELVTTSKIVDLRISMHGDDVFPIRE